jgi:hypothetical protein
MGALSRAHCGAGSLPIPADVPGNANVGQIADASNALGKAVHQARLPLLTQIGGRTSLLSATAQISPVSSLIAT